MSNTLAQKRVLFAKFPLLTSLILLSLLTTVSGQYYGMQFNAHEHSLDQRSGLDLTPDGPISLKDDLNLQFHLRFAPDRESYFGYVFRLIIGDQNIDFIHGVVPENPNNFELIIGSTTSKIAFQIPLEELIQDWTKLSFELDFKNKKIRCLVNDITLEDDLVGVDEKDGFRLMFGAHSYGNFSSTDVPAMILRDVEVLCNGQDNYAWPLNETQGEIAHSSSRGNNALAKNPIWLLKRHNTWESVLKLNFPGQARTAFDPQNNDLYILSKDSVYIYDVVSMALKAIPHSMPSYVESPVGLIFNTVNNRLTVYSLENNFITHFDIETGEWSPPNSGNEVEADYWHHNSQISPHGSIITFGGYGHFMYKNTVLIWNQEEEGFEELVYNGNFHPRYLAGAGFNPSDSLYYIVGGYGSESGKQSESPDYYYDIHSFSLKDSTFSDVFEFQNTQAGFCFANSIVFDENNNMYALYFPKYEFNNKLQLIKISLQTPEIIEVGDPIEYSFLDVNSYADLFYNEGNNSLLATSSYTSDEQTIFSVHTVAFPPQKFTAVEATSEKSSFHLLFYAVAAFILLIIGLLLIQYRKRRIALPKEAVVIPREKNVPRSKKNSIILFGGFQVIDRNGKDITGQFTPLPKKLFLFILLHSLRNNKGVSSAVLYETFWFDKSVESARNNRAVNIVKLKSLLDNLDSASISKETGYWKFDFDSSLVQIDYFLYLEIIRQTNELTREDIVELRSLIENKTFLNNTQADWLDKFKSDVSNEIIDTFIRYMATSKDDPEFLLHITNCIFLFDAVSEEALKVQIKLLIKQGKHSLAKSSYSKFTREYRLLYDEDYALSFNQLIDEKSLPEGE